MIFKTSLAIAVSVVLSACSSVPAAQLPGTGNKNISIQFQDFDKGSICTAETPQGSVTAPNIPGIAEYPVEFSNSPVACTTPDGSVYDINIGELLPDGHGTAGITAYQTGFLVATTVLDGNLVQLQSDTGVVKRSTE